MDFNCERSEPTRSAECLWDARLDSFKILRLTTRSDFSGSRSAQAGGLAQCVCAVRALPSKRGSTAAKVTVGGRGLVDRAAQIQSFDDALGRQHEELANQRRDFFFRHGSGSKSISHDRNRLSNPDGISQLHFGLAREARSHDV